MKNNKGFTLIELVIALFIVTVIFGFFSISTKAYINFSESKSINGLMFNIVSAQRKSMASNRYYSVYANISDNRALYLEGENSNIRKKYELYSTLKFINNFKFRFTPSGTPDVGVTIDIKGKYKDYTITVEVATGKVNLK